MVGAALGENWRKNPLLWGGERHHYQNGSGGREVGEKWKMSGGKGEGKWKIPRFETKSNLFILVLDQNCRSNCTDQGLNREHLPVLAVVLPWRSSVTLSKSNFLNCIFKRERFAKIITPTHPALHFNGFKERAYTLNSVSLPTPRFPPRREMGTKVKV